MGKTWTNVAIASVIAMTAFGCDTDGPTKATLDKRGAEALDNFKSIAKDVERIELEVECEDHSEALWRYGPIVVADNERISTIANMLLTINELRINDSAHAVPLGGLSARVVLIGRHPTRVFRLRILAGDLVAFGDRETFCGRLPNNRLSEYLNEIAVDHAKDHPEDAIEYEN